MKTKKQVGIWMDHTIALVLELNNDRILQSSVESGFTHDEKEFTLSKSEKTMHNTEKQEQSSYYKTLSGIIRNFEEVVLFGPTNAKNELVNLLKADHLFENIRIEVKDSDKMTENQMHTFVKEYFK